jgi:hypothetical protein
VAQLVRQLLQLVSVETVVVPQHVVVRRPRRALSEKGEMLLIFYVLRGISFTQISHFFPFYTEQHSPLFDHYMFNVQSISLLICLMYNCIIKCHLL